MSTKGSRARPVIGQDIMTNHDSASSTVKKRNSQQYPVYPGRTYPRGSDRYAGNSMIVTSLNNVALAVRTSVKCRGSLVLVF